MIVKNLVPPEVEMEDFRLSIIELIANFQSIHNISCTYHITENGLLEKLNTEQKTHIYRIIQEAMTNAAKHANPREINVVVREEVSSNFIYFFITDDGCGFEQQSFSPKNLEKSTKLGLKGMESRALLLKGNLSISSDEETGTHIKLSVPI